MVRSPSHVVTSTSSLSLPIPCRPSYDGVVAVITPIDQCAPDLRILVPNRSNRTPGRRWFSTQGRSVPPAQGGAMNEKNHHEEHAAHDVFVLSGGAARGAVQVGMMQTLVEAGIVPDG